MKRPYQHVELEQHGDVFCAHICPRKLDEQGIHLLGNELADLIEQGGCRRLVLSLGPGTLECLYSVFMAKLVMIHRRLLDHQGAMIMCDVTPEVLTVFEACKLQNYFEFAPDVPSAVAAMKSKAIS
jgi:anti-anti-sigma factor